MNAEQLKASILQQAIEGKLVPQLDSEEEVHQIGDAPENVPFAIPEKWKWCSLKELVYPTKQKIPDSNFTYIDVASINDYQVRNAKTLDAKDAPSRARKIVKEGMILYSTVRPYLMNICIASNIKDETIASTAFATFACSAAVTNKYLFYVLISEHMSTYVKSVQKGVAYPAISDKDFYKAWIPIPPTEEQDRIVAKVEELLPLIEAYGRSYDSLQELNAELPGKLKASILQEAIQGKIVPQLAEEGFVERVGDGSKEVPFEIPDSWKWIRLDGIATIVRGGSPRPIKSFITEREDGLNWIKIGDAERGTARISHCAEKIVPEGLKKTRFIKRGSLLLTNSMSFGYPYILDVDGCIHDGWLAFSDFESVLNRDYLYYVLLSPYCRSIFVSKAAGAVVKNLNIDKVKEVLIPVPPILEQARIVAKVEELLKQVDALLARR